jgi:hypothetical protein
MSYTADFRRRTWNYENQNTLVVQPNLLQPIANSLNNPPELLP